MDMTIRFAAGTTVVGYLAAAVVLASPSAAADCAGALQAQMIFGAPSRAYIPPPAGLDYATQPAADLTATAGDVFGIVNGQRDNGCRVPGARASVASRDAGTTAFSTRRTGTTNAYGYLSFQVFPPRTTYLRGEVVVGSETARTPPVLRTVRPVVRATFSSPGGCVMLAEGSTFPAKPNHPVWLQRRIIKNGTESGYTTVSRSVTDAEGKFHVAYKAPCGADYALAAYIPASATNTDGRSLYVDLHVKAVR
jgi:hypothetical protein